MMGFIGSFESLAYGLLGQAMHGSVGQGQRQRTHVIRQTSRASIDRLVAAYRQVRRERDIAVRERDELRTEVARLRVLAARSAHR